MLPWLLSIPVASFHKLVHDRGDAGVWCWRGANPGANVPRYDTVSNHRNHAWKTRFGLLHETRHRGRSAGFVYRGLPVSIRRTIPFFLVAADSRSSEIASSRF